MATSKATSQVSGIDRTLTQNVAAFTMKLPAGACVSFYTAFAGFYGKKFESRSFFLACLMTAYTTFAIVGWLQQRFDAYYDRMYGTKATNLLRVALMPTLMASCVLTWIAMPQMPVTVLVAGGLLGFMAAVQNSSSTQVCAAMNPECLVFADLGDLSGSALPIIVFNLTGFGPDSTLNHFKAIIMFLAGTCLASSLFFTFFHFSMDLYAKAFSRLEYDLYDDLADDMPTGMQRQETETQPLLADEDGQAQDWVWKWSCILGLNGFLAFFSFALCTFGGGMEFAQMLALTKLAADFVAGLGAICWKSMVITAPQHYGIAAITLIRICLFVPLTRTVVQPGTLSGTQLLTAWFLYFGLFALLKSIVGVTTTRYAPVKDRKATARSNFQYMFCGIVLGLLVAAVFVDSTFGMSKNWPSWTTVIQE